MEPCCGRVEALQPHSCRELCVRARLSCTQVRLINVGNVLHASNPTTAASLIASFDLALKAGKKLPLSFYKTLESPSVALYQKGQDAVIASCVQAERRDRFVSMPCI